MDISRPCQPEKLIPLLPWPGFDPSFSGHNDRRAIITEWTWLRLIPLSHRGWLVANGKLRPTLQLWWYPPQTHLVINQPPSSPDLYYDRPFFLRMPYRMWKLRLVCIRSACGGHQLTSCGLYKTVRRVLDLDGYYHMGTEYLECGGCHKKYAAWSAVILNQLDLGHRSQFPALLTYRWVSYFLKCYFLHSLWM